MKKPYKIVSGASALAFVLVFLFLAAQYESWLIPVAVVLAIPFSLIGARWGPPSSPAWPRPRCRG